MEGSWILSSIQWIKMTIVETSDPLFKRFVWLLCEGWTLGEPESEGANVREGCLASCSGAGGDTERENG